MSIETVGKASPDCPDWIAAVLSVSSDGILIETGQRIVAVNEICLRWLGFAGANELVGQPLSRLVADSSPQALEELGRRDAAGTPPRPFSLPIRRRDGALRPLEATICFVMAGGNRHRIFCLRDPAARTGVEAERPAGEGTYLNATAHDLNNLLTAIRCQTELVLVYETIPSTVREMLQKVITATDRASNLVRQLRAFSRRPPMQPTTVDLNALLGQLTGTLRRQIGTEVEIRLDSTVPLPLIHADSSLLEKVLVELAVNARAAMAQGGIFTISTTRVRLAAGDPQRHPAARPGEFVVLAARDTGCGIAPEQLPRIFEPSFSTNAKGKGNGLGLAKAREIIREHQGWFEVESEVGQGTSVRIFLPARRDLGDVAVQIPRAPAAGRASETLLVVAADPELSKLMGLTLTKLGYQVLVAGAEVEAVELWRRRGPEIALLLTDMTLPGGSSGLELVQRLRAGHRELKAMVMSEAVMNLPGVQVLVKPFDPASLARAIRDCLDDPSASA